MTRDELLSLESGDRVMVRRDAPVGIEGKLEERLVKYPPWQLGHGQWVIGLHGIVGGFMLERVESIVSRGPDPDVVVEGGAA